MSAAEGWSSCTEAKASLPSSTRAWKTFTVPRKFITNSVAGWWNTSSGVPSCSMRPSFITTTRSATSRASSWSCVTKTLVTWISSCRRRSQARSCLRTWASSAPKGSSSSSTRGSTASARARATRWRWPPESWFGIAVGHAVELHQLQQVVDLAVDDLARRADAPRLHAQAEGDVLEDGHVPEQRVVLEHEPDAALLHASCRPRPPPGTGWGRCPDPAAPGRR